MYCRTQLGPCGEASETIATLAPKVADPPPVCGTARSGQEYAAPNLVRLEETNEMMLPRACHL